MRSRFAEPTARMVGGLFVIAFAFLLVSALTLNFGSTDMTAFGYLSILLGLIFLFVGLAQFAMRKLNLKYGRPEA